MTIEVYEGCNSSSSGSAINQTTTDSDGFYSFENIQAGYYTMLVSGAGYSSTTFNAIAIGGEVRDRQKTSIFPLIDGGEVRIVLTWGETPRDLDAHLAGPTADGDRFHIFYANRNYWYNDVHIVNLDREDINSFGPETITIYEQAKGMYRYSVHDYTNRSSSTSTALSNSDAQVTVYFGDQEVERFLVPSGLQGTLWTVFLK